MALVTSGEGRTEQRDIYVPGTDRSMAHLSNLSPDGTRVLITEMGPTGEFLPCRVVPFDGSSSGIQVGPRGNPCVSAAWSLDGKWMYLNVSGADGLHIWRQRYPTGVAEQVTFGPNTQSGIAIAPDGSLLTSVGGGRSSVWLRHRPAPDREISPQGFTYDPQFSPDGKSLYCLRIKQNLNGDTNGNPASAAHSVKEEATLLRVDLATFQIDTLFPGLSVRSYSLSPDGKRVVFAVEAGDGKFQIWVAALDLRSPPVRLQVPEGADRPHFISDRELLIRTLQTGKHYLERVRLDGSGLRRILAGPVVEFESLSPDRQWVIGPEPDTSDSTRLRNVAHRLDGSDAVPVCWTCNAEWSSDSKTMYFDFGFNGEQVIAVPTATGSLFPPLPPQGVESPAEALKLKGAHRIEAPGIQSPLGSATAITKQTVQRNIYRIPVK